jgi:predicted TIM-barrel fold metal-dependent hydrolase
VIIDTHAHYYGEALFRRLAVREGVPRVVAEGGQRFMVTPTSRFVLQGGFVDLGARLDWMAGQGIDHQLITFPGALGPEVLPAADAIPITRDVNDELADVVRAHPAQFSALAGLPMADVGACAVELERAMGRGLRGAILPSNYFLSLAGMATLEPLFAAADRLGAHLMLHPGQRHDESLEPRVWPDLAMHRASTIELHGGITHALLTLIHSGALQRFPRVTWHVVNLGGQFPFVVERMDHIVASRDPAAPRPSQLLGGIVFDCASLGPRALEMGVKVFGAERVMFGTDYPIFATDVSRNALREADISPEQRALVAAGTARAVLGIGA